MKKLLHRAGNKARFAMPSMLTAVAYMLFRAGGAYFEDGLLTVHNSDFRRDPKFQKAYGLGKATGSWGRQDVRWRCYVCCWAAWSVREKEGDFVECGVYRGGYSRAVMHYIDFTALNKRFWLLDTYEGLVEHLISEDERRRGILPGGYDSCYEQVVETFKPFHRVHLIKGIIPDTLRQVNVDKVCYLSLDMNNAAPEIAAAEHFWNKIVSGGIVVLDDYGWAKQVNQKIAFDEFADAHGIKILSLPTGQGLIIKP
jgi:hypothetical protein